ncbi:MAG: G5 domain-containing protein [Anaerolineaceae bacterium]
MKSSNFSKYQLIKPLLFILLLASLSGFLAGCSSVSSSSETIQITLIVDQSQQLMNATKGITVSELLDQAKVSLSTLDRVDPPLYTQLMNNGTITITRVREEYEVEENIIQFEHQTVRNESLPEGQTRLIQAGVNGTQQITYRIVYENDVQVSKTIFKTTILSSSRPEIVMVGVQTPFTAIEIPGTIVYLTAGNAWVMEGNTGIRRPIITTGDLDGRIFDLSSDGKWLLFTRKVSSTEEGEDQINELFAVDVTKEEPQPIDLRISNIIQHAAWVPGSPLTITYSTVEPRSTAPGWQANNDLILYAFSDTGMIVKRETIIDTNSGGIYGWWGTSFSWSSDGNRLAYSRPDSIGFVDFETKSLIPLLQIVPLQTKGDWAWVPGVCWAPEDDLLYVTLHGSGTSNTSPETSQVFHVGAILDSEIQATLVEQTGMFAYPVTSPQDTNGRFQIAYLQAIFSDQSESSRYRLYIMDQDGSNRALIFPDEGSTGLQPQQVTWGMTSPSSQRMLGLIYQGNLWLITPGINTASQITGDGSIVKIDWE